MLTYSMRSRLIIWLGVFTLCGNAVSSAASDCPLISYATNPIYPPFGWTEDGKNYLGASTRLLELLVPPGVGLKPIVVPWIRAQGMAEKGQIDLLLSIRATPEREKYLNFISSPAFSNAIVAFALKESPLKSADWVKMQSFRGGVSRGDSFGNGFDEYLKQKLNVEVSLNMATNFKKLALGRIDYFVSGEYLGRAYLASKSAEDKFHIVPLKPPISSGNIHFAFAKNSPCNDLVASMNAKLAELNRQGVPQRLLDEALIKFTASPSYQWP